MKKELLKEASIVDLTDDQIIDLISYSYEALKNIEEQSKNDSELLKLKLAIKEYIDDHYRPDLLRYKGQLKAAIKQARIRNINYKLPEEVK